MNVEAYSTCTFNSTRALTNREASYIAGIGLLVKPYSAVPCVKKKLPVGLSLSQAILLIILVLWGTEMAKIRGLKFFDPPTLI